MKSSKSYLTKLGIGLIASTISTNQNLNDLCVYAQNKNNSPLITQSENAPNDKKKLEDISRDTLTENVQIKTLDIPKSNYQDAERKSIDTIVLHTTEGSGNSALNTFNNPNSKVSAHYLVVENGTIYSLVNDEDIAWHCKGHNKKSIGIEIAGFYNRDLLPSQVGSVQKLIKLLQKKYNLSKTSVKPHSSLDPKRRKDPGEANFNRILAGI